MLANVLGLASPEEVFPWQEDLLARFQRSEIPSALDIPTGLGKTAVRASWLVARACGPKLPRRLVYVVDRRAVVDQATDVALGLRAFVDAHRVMKNHLVLRHDQSLPISTLRGQYVDSREWLEDPATPSIIVGTVDMVGSRLLVEGYGVSRKMRPYPAGLLGADTLVVLDEAHLVPPFEQLLRGIAEDDALRGRDPKCGALVPPFRLLSLSAMGRTQGDGVVGLTEKDLDRDVVKRRLFARKSLRIEEFDEATKLEDALAKHAWVLAEEGKKPVRVLVYADRREVARKAKEGIEKLAKGDKNAGNPQMKIETELFVAAGGYSNAKERRSG
jgi:CRISPR-associated endonuclease/helicase Cas3